jgi:putative heme-binding domain-containing protein
MRFALLLLMADLCFGQAPKPFADRCAACHGADAEGSTQGPKLAGNRRLRTRSAAQIRGTIRNGIPASGMPAFPVDGKELDDLAKFVRSLNIPAAEVSMAGDPAAGAAFFRGEGRCAACHMVNGRGAAVGPDLSNAGKELSAAELREALLQPGAHIATGYALVNVRLRDGKSLRGFAHGRTNFDLQLQDLSGGLHMLRQDDIADLREETASLMPAVKQSPEVVQNLVAYLAGLGGVGPATEKPVASAPARSAPGDWSTFNGNVNGNRYSELRQIDTGNVSSLAVNWIFPVNHFGLETTPLVADGIMYITGPNQAWALDAATGRAVWHYARPRSTGLVGDASLGTNKGMALAGDQVFMVTDDAHLLALNRITGALVWEVVMPEETMKYGSTIAPLVVKDSVIAGVSGGDWGIRGFVVCYEVGTGRLKWRHWTVPEGTKLGGSTWLTGAYDADSDTVYWPTGNPWPDSDDRDRPRDNLYTNSILALDANTGERRWHYQFTPHDVHDWDGTEPPVLVDAVYKGSPRKLLLHADRNGFFYVLDRTNGNLLLAKPFLKNLTWAGGIGADGRPILKTPADGVMCPVDGANYDSVAFSPVTRLFYVMTLEQCRQEKRTGPWNGREPLLPTPQKVLRAIDIETGAIAWETPFIGPVSAKNWAGVLGTAGGLLFYQDPNGAFAAADERTGRLLWHFPTNVPMKSSPMTYIVGGRQYVALAAGPNIISFALPSK